MRTTVSGIIVAVMAWLMLKEGRASEVQRRERSQGVSLLLFATTILVVSKKGTPRISLTEEQKKRISGTLCSPDHY